MEEIEFDLWWAEFLRTQGKNDWVHDTDRLQKYYLHLDNDNKVSFLTEILNVSINNKEGSGLALELLKREAKYEHFKSINDKILSITDIDGNIDYLAALLTTLSYFKSNEFIGTFTKFYLNYNKFKITAPYSLYKTHPEIYLNSWIKYFKSVSRKEWENTGIFYGLLDHKVLLHFKKRLRTSPFIWRSMYNSIKWAIESYSLIDNNEKQLIMQNVLKLHN